MAERLALQRTAEMVDTAAKYAFHSKRSVLTVPDLHVAGGASGHGDAAAAMPQVLRVTDTVDLLCRAEAEVEATNVGDGRWSAQALKREHIVLYTTVSRAACLQFHLQLPLTQLPLVLC